MPKILTILLFILIFSPPSLLKSEAEEESLFLRRIQNLTEEEDLPLLESEIASFFKLFPSSSFKDSLKALLAEKYVSKQLLFQALSLLESIDDPDVKDKVAPLKWWTLYLMKNFHELKKELEPYLENNSWVEKERLHFLYAEACYEITLCEENNDLYRDQDLIHRALEYYERVSPSCPYGLNAKLSCAEIFKQQGSWEKACDIYVELGKTQPEKENFLFPAALVCLEFNEKKALALFKKVALLEKSYSSEAAYHWLQLCSHLNRWQEIEDNQSLFKRLLPENRMPLFNFYLGCYLRQKNQLALGAFHLKAALQKGLHFPYEYQALKSLYECACTLQDAQLVESTYEELIEKYPNEAYLSAFTKSLFYQNQNRIHDALSLSEEWIERCDSLLYLEKFLKLRINLYIEKSMWYEAYNECSRFCKKINSNDEITEKQLQIALKIRDEFKDLAPLTLHLEKLFSKDTNAQQNPEICLLLARCYFEQEAFEKALSILHNNTEISADSEALLMLCLLKTDKNEDQILYHGEQAILLQPTVCDPNRLRLYLFNLYLKKSKQDPKNELWALKAQNHLEAVVNKLPISLKNRFWLVHRLLDQKAPIEKIISLLKPLFNDTSLFERFPQEGLTLVRLLIDSQQFNEAEEFILHFEEEISKHPCYIQENWLLLKGKCLERKAKTQAHKIYLSLIHSTSTDIRTQSLLSLALSSEDLAPDLLEELKTLWLQKEAVKEPLHLDAALLWGLKKISFEVSSTEKQNTWRMLITHFSNENDIWSKDYHEALKGMPDKKEILTNYLSLFEALLLEEQKRSYALEGNNKSETQTRDRQNSVLKSLSKSCLSSYAHKACYFLNLEPTPLCKESL